MKSFNSSAGSYACREEETSIKTPSITSNKATLFTRWKVYLVPERSENLKTKIQSSSDDYATYIN